ncbi:PTS sugar transporter subunit IIA [Companilactobacillus ginsenosidimutans]|uniref:PTS glucose transporter subunit IIABC n=1 Tax=Companilactobacillus ginsenosidimutans TaxID=1007676 RepID=A0A0H4QIP6_9LACO|nr:PTS glucose transporter subunit IIA [Companilactobacillus ginsenosidimutans]AKP66553.1 PTS glucose transporter subunit IIABC [Companilactobacillus ginsenosidimutans]
MGLFSRKNKQENLFAPIDGQLIPLDQVKDDVFSKKMMGDGFAVEPNDGTVVSPVEGTVSSVFPTKHAMMIESKEGLEIMLHLGLDTVELNGEPFDVTVKEGQSLTAGQQIASMDLDKITQSNKETTVIVIVSNMDKVKSLSDVRQKNVSAGDVVQTAEIQK